MRAATLPASPDDFRPMPDWLRAMLSAAVGTGATWLIFSGLSRLQDSTPAKSPPPIDDIREIAVPMEPPPPEVRPREVVPLAGTTLVAFAAVRSESVVKLPALPAVEDVVAPPALAVPKIDFTAKEFKPSDIDSEFESRHIFNQEDVDQPCAPLVKVQPRASQFMLRAADRLYLSFLLVVGKNGEVESVRLLESSGNIHLDKACIEALNDWKFSPAVRRGRRVRQWAQQAIRFKIEVGHLEVP